MADTNKGVQTYDPERVHVTFGNIFLSDGVADGTWITATLPEGFTMVVGALGNTARARSRNRTVQFVLTLLQTSALNALLSEHFEADKAGANGVGPMPFEIKDLAGTTEIRAAKAWVMSPPEVSYSGGIETRVWTFEGTDTRTSIGGNPDS